MTHTFKINARGFLVQRLQKALGIQPDGIFGARTHDAIAALQRTLPAGVSAPLGEAGPAEFAAVGIPWPSPYERAMNLVSCFEGTSFGDCNRTDMDGAGLTLGIAGFTTRHGEVQRLLARYLSELPGRLADIPPGLQSRLLELLARRGNADAWKNLFFATDGRVVQPWLTAFSKWGPCETMQRMQLEAAHNAFWLPATKAAESLGFPTLQGLTFFLDVAVQNGGWRKSHLVVARRMIDWQSEDPTRALTVAARAVAACAKEPWRNDVLSRKMVLATGTGVVHGREWDLRNFALM